MGGESSIPFINLKHAYCCILHWSPLVILSMWMISTSYISRRCYHLGFPLRVVQNPATRNDIQTHPNDLWVINTSFCGLKPRVIIWGIWAIPVSPTAALHLHALGNGTAQPWTDLRAWMDWVNVVTSVFDIFWYLVTFSLDLPNLWAKTVRFVCNMPVNTSRIWKSHQGSVKLCFQQAALFQLYPLCSSVAGFAESPDKPEPRSCLFGSKVFEKN